MVRAIVGANWGDEGKGKITDVLAAESDVVIRFQGGSNAGHTIIIYSARTWVEYEMTVDWLNRHGVKYHQLFMGKPVGDVWIDDRAITAGDNWGDIRARLLPQEPKAK